MAEPVVVSHPTFPTVVHEVPADKAKEWTDAGWARVKRADEEEVLANADESPVQ